MAEQDLEWVATLKRLYNLDITKYAQEIVKMMKARTSFLISPTGSGKSLAAPAFPLIEGGMKRVFVTVPTKAGVIAVSSRQREIYKGTNIKVGYAAESEVHYDKDTNLIYCTAGHMRLKLLNCFREFHKTGNPEVFRFADCMMVDEIHSRDISNDVITGLWEEANDNSRPVPNLFLATATPMDLPIKHIQEKFEVPLTLNFPVETQFLGKDYPLVDGRKQLYLAAVEKIVQEHIAQDVDSGHFLVFCPGKGEVETVAVGVRSKLEQIANNAENTIVPPYQVYSLTGQTKTEDLDMINVPSPGMRKIFVGTNVVEMSVTVQNLTLVVDTLCEKVAKTAPNGGSKLVVDYISMDSSKQRRGRTGRTCPGVYYVLASVETYENLIPHRLPEVMRLPLHTTCLEILDAGLEPRKILHDAPGISIINSYTMLQALHMIEKQDGKTIVTSKGRVASTFPLSIQNASFLFDWIRKQYDPYVGLVIAFLVDGYDGSYYFIPGKEKGETSAEYQKRKAAYQREWFGKYTGLTDIHTLLNLWNDFWETTGGKNPKVWCAQRSVNAKKWSNVCSLLNKTATMLARRKLLIEPKIIDVSAAVGMCREIFPLSYPIYALKDDDTYVDNQDRIYFPHTGDVMHKYKKWNTGNKNFSPDNKPFPRAIVPLLTMESGGDKNVRATISLFLDVKPGVIGLTINPEIRVISSAASQHFISQLIARKYVAGYFPRTASERSPPSFPEEGKMVSWKMKQAKANPPYTKWMEYVLQGIDVPEEALKGPSATKDILKRSDYPVVHEEYSQALDVFLEPKKAWDNYERLLRNYVAHPYELTTLNNYLVDDIQRVYNFTHELFTTPFTTQVLLDKSVRYTSWNCYVDMQFGSLGNTFTYQLRGGSKSLIILPTKQPSVSSYIAEWIREKMDSLTAVTFVIVSADGMDLPGSEHTEIKNVVFKTLMGEAKVYKYPHHLYLLSNDPKMNNIFPELVEILAK